MLESGSSPRRRHRWVTVGMAVVLGASVLSSISTTPGVAAATSLNLVAVADAQVNSDNPAFAYGSETKMAVCTSCALTGAPTKRAYVRFDTAAVTGVVTSVTLRLYTTTPAGPLDVHGVALPWSESTLTWNNAPPRGAEVGRAAATSRAGWVDIPLEAVGTGSYVVETTSSAVTRIASRETSTKPQLILTVDTGTTSTSTTTTSSSTSSTSSTTTTTTPQPPSRPNVLVIVTDDQRDAPSTMAVMPRTSDWLVRGGRDHTQAYVTTPSCCPSRSSILSGRYVHNHGVAGQEEAADLDQSATLPKYLKDAGYATGMAGKYLNSWPLATRPPNFDRVAMVKGGYTNQYWNLDGTVRQLPDYTTTYIGTKAVEFIDAFDVTNDAKPWFIMLTPLAPHSPRNPEPKYASAPVPPWPGNPAVNESVTDKPFYLSWRPTVSQSEIDSVRTGTLRTLMSVDDMVDRVMRQLEARGELDNTMVIYTSDNGYQWGEHRYFGKFTPYTASVQVPMFLRWPGKVAAGATSDSLVTNLDIAPTILEAAGARVTGPPLDGRSLLSSGSRNRLLLEYTFDTANGSLSAPTWSSTLTRTHQYVENVTRDGTGVVREYYDMVADPWQLTNLYGNGTTADDPPVAPLAAQLSADRACSGSSCP